MVTKLDQLLVTSSLLAVMAEKHGVSYLTMRRIATALLVDLPHETRTELTTALLRWRKQ